MGKKILKSIVKYPLMILNRIWIYLYFKLKKGYKGKEEVSFSQGKKILVLAPHVDDETIGLGGSLLKYSRLDTPLSLLYLTDGSGSTSHLSKEETVRLRREEGFKVKEGYGFNDIHFLDKVDGSLSSQDTDLIEKLTKLLDKIQPDIIFSPFLIDGNTDHIETTKALHKALELWDSNFENIYLYQVNTIIDPKLVNAVGLLERDIYEEKLNKFDIFKSQWAMGFSIFHLLDRGRALALGNIHGAEAFVKVSSSILGEIILELEECGFDPHLFKQISSEFTLLTSLLKSRKDKNVYNGIVEEIMRSRELGGSPI